MKSYEEMTHDVLSRIESEKKQKKRRVRIALSGVSVICVCLAAFICINFLGGNAAQTVQAADLMDGITPGTAIERAADERFRDNQMRLAVELFQYTADGADEGENLLISPLSIQLALAMTANGAGTSTLEEMERVLGGDISADELNEYLYSYISSLPSDDKTKLEIANSIWLRDTFEVNRDFLQTNADYYGAAAYRSAFDAQTVKDINTWVNENTDGMIPKIIEGEMSPLTVMYLINAIVFDGKWEKVYTEENVSDSKFFAYDGKEQDAELMYAFENTYIRDDNAVGFIKNYAGGQYSFAALLPNEGVDIYDYIEGLTPKGLAETLQERITDVDVHTYLPKFSYEYGASMKEILADMGMPTAFIESEADLSGIGNGSLFIGDVQHNTFISVDENGTKAAAVTSVMAENTAAAPSYTVRLDRPFVYMILDNETNLPVFIGALTEIGE